MTIWKFPLEKFELQTIRMPQGANIIAAQIQEGAICLWALVDPARPLEPRDFFTCGTGARIVFEKIWYIGTVQDPPFVWHVFERVK
jgi:hypothetical protein